MKKMPLICVLCSVAMLYQANLQACEIVEFSSERISDEIVAVTGYVTTPYKRVQAKVLRFSEVIGSGVNHSENTGYFNVKVRTSRKASRRPYVIVSCLK